MLVMAGGMTWFVFLVSVIVAFSGFIIGYEVGIIGGVLLIPEFLNHLFPKGISESMNYLDKLADHASFIYICSFLPIMFAIFSYLGSDGKSTTHRFPSRICIMLGGIYFLVGAVVSAIAFNDGRIGLGFGLGFIQQVRLYISETAHYNHRCALNIGFHTMITIGIFVANLVNYVTYDTKGWWSWRVSIGLAAIPATIICIGSFLLPESPSSSIEQGDYDRARCTLKCIRGTTDINREFNSLWDANETSKRVDGSWAYILAIRKHKPYYVMAIAIPIFQQLAGINAMVFYAPLLFKIIGFGSDASLKFGLIIGGVNVVATILAIIMANRLSRRSLLIAGGLQIFVCQVILGSLGVFVDSAHSEYAIANLLVVALICLCVSGYAWSWGPLGWSLPSEIFPLEMQYVGEVISSATNILSSYIVTRVFVCMLDHYKFGIFYLFAVFALIMTLFAIYFIPERKGTPIEEMSNVWNQHWFWSQYFKTRRLEC